MTPIAMRCKALLCHSLADTLYWSKQAYYGGHYGNDFSIPDETYDKMEDLLESLCPDHPILHCVGTCDDAHISTVKIYKLLEEREKITSSPKALS